MDGDFEGMYHAIAEDKNTIARAFHIEDQINFDDISKQYREYAARLRPMVSDTATLVNGAIADGKSVLFEGAQGTMLDIDHGTYPFVTSSSATAGGACTGIGHRSHAHQRRGRNLEGLHHAGRLGTVPHRGPRSAGRSDPESRQGVRLSDGPPAALRLVRRAAAALHGAW